MFLRGTPPLPRFLDFFCYCYFIFFCRNDNVIQVEKLEHCARASLNVAARRVMGALSPIKVLCWWWWWCYWCCRFLQPLSPMVVIWRVKCVMHVALPLCVCVGSISSLLTAAESKTDVAINFDCKCKHCISRDVVAN